MSEKLIDLSDQILTKLLLFKENHSEFTFSLRKRNSVQSKGEKRLEIGQWFQGSEYIYVPLFKRGDNNRKIKTIGFVVNFNEQGIASYIEISFKAAGFSTEEIEFHKLLAEKIGLQLNAHNHGNWSFPDQVDLFKNLDFYLNDFRTWALQILQEKNLNDLYLITEDEFQQDLERVKLIRNQLYPMKEQLSKTVDLLKFKKQIILQGPPGTGKTRLAMQLAQAITGISKNELSKSEQVEVVQFHPSYSYEDLVEGLKASTKGDMVVYQPENGVFKNFCLRALIACLQPEENDELEAASFDSIYNKYVEEIQPLIGQVFSKTKNNSELILESATASGITIRYRFRDRANSTAGVRPFSVSKAKLRRVVDAEINPNDIKNLKAELQPIVGHIAGELFGVYRHLYDFMQKHTISLDEVKTNDYDFQSAIEQYWEQKDNINFDNIKPFVFIIDEMNRANLSTVFGELISLMEDGKRIGADEAMSLKLPYSNDDFGIPKNLYIIGTMNTADRSVSQIDYAIRRRFAFVDVLPKNLSDEQEVVFDGALFNDVKKLFVNNDEQQSEFLSPEFKAKEVQLGHSYFINKGGNMPMRLEYEIKPILFEYIRDGILRETARTVIKDLKCSE